MKRSTRIRLSRRASATMALVMVAVLSAAGCATTPLPVPQDESRSLVIVGLQIETQSALPMSPSQTDYAPGKLMLKRADASAPSGRLGQTEVLSNYPHGQLYLFANVVPGTYYVDHFTKSLPGLVGESHPDYNLVFTFPPAAVTATTVRVPPRSIVYLGEFSGRYRQRTVPPPLMFRYDVVDTSGQRNDKRKAQAIEAFKRKYGDSPWSAYSVSP